MTEVIQVDALHPDPAAIARAGTALRDGKLVAFPTETVYGLGVHALDASAVRRLFAAKQRPATDPLIVHVRSLDDIRPLVSEIPAPARELASRFWPGPLTLVLPRSTAVPVEVTAGLDTVALRVPAHPVARALIDAAGVPVAAPSANLFSRPSPTSAAHVLEDLGGIIDLVVDGGPTSVGVESTVVDLTAEVPRILRPGAVTIDMLRSALPGLRSASDRVAAEGTPMPSPGLLEKHYSPRAPLTLYEGTGPDVLRRLAADARSACGAGRRVGILAADEDGASLPSEGYGIHIVSVGSRHDPRQVATRLYAALRELDAAGVDTILARDFPPDGGLCDAIHDRLRRAAAGRVVR